MAGGIILTVCLTLAGVGILWLLSRFYAAVWAEMERITPDEPHEYIIGDIRLVDARNSHSTGDRL